MTKPHAFQLPVFIVKYQLTPLPRRVVVALAEVLNKTSERSPIAARVNRELPTGRQPSNNLFFQHEARIEVMFGNIGVAYTAE